MSEVCNADFFAAAHRGSNAVVNQYYFNATRPGETTRTCERCGSEFEPRSRTQRYCSKDCRGEGKAWK